MKEEKEGGTCKLYHCMVENLFLDLFRTILQNFIVGVISLNLPVSFYICKIICFVYNGE
jgi:hypothetical protein